MPLVNSGKFDWDNWGFGNFLITAVVLCSNISISLSLPTLSMCLKNYSQGSTFLAIFVF